MIGTYYDISNDPVSGLSRKAKITNLAIGENTIGLTIKIMFFGETDEINYRRIQPYTVDLIADNLTFVDADGDYVSAAAEGAIGEFNFIKGYINNGNPLSPLIEKVITRADEINRFDI